MCGIWALLQNRPLLSSAEAFAAFQAICHRGPDHSSFQRFSGQETQETQEVFVGFHRLAIMDRSVVSHQPFVFEDSLTGETVVFLCNGEIYQHRSLATMFLQGISDLDLDRMNDCRVLAEIYWSMRYTEDPLTTFVDILRDHVHGEYAFLAFHFDRDHRMTLWVAGRDQIGVRPLYYGTDTSVVGTSTSTLVFSSEVKGIPAAFCAHEFPPGTLMVGNGKPSTVAKIPIRPVYAILPREVGELPDAYYLTRVREMVRDAVLRRLTADQPLFFLLSGGVDSSLVAAIAAEDTRKKGGVIHTACCGMTAGTYRLTGPLGQGEPFTIGEGADLAYARLVAAHIGSTHHEVLFTPQEGIDALRDVIRTVETWDTTTVRASVGQYMVCRWIAQHTDAKVVLVGEGPDEVCSSYLFNEYAPSAQALHDTAREYVERVHLFDGRRVDRCVSRWGLEARVPLLDPEFIAAYWEIPAAERMPAARGIEKWWLREAFAAEPSAEPSALLPAADGVSAADRVALLPSAEQVALLPAADRVALLPSAEQVALLPAADRVALLPSAVRLRKKSAFSDSMTSERSWGTILTEWADLHVTDEELANAAQEYPYCTPQTKEAYMYRRIFCEVIGADRQEILPGYWQPKWNSQGLVSTYMDPSALVLRGDLPQTGTAI